MHRRDEVLAALTQHRERLKGLGASEIALFGSCARHEATEGSDLDFIVELNPKTFDAYMDTKEFLEALFNSEVDLVIRDAIKPELRKAILGDAVYACRDVSTPIHCLS